MTHYPGAQVLTHGAPPWMSALPNAEPLATGLPTTTNHATLVSEGTNVNTVFSFASIKQNKDRILNALNRWDGSSPLGMVLAELGVTGDYDLVAYFDGWPDTILRDLVKAYLWAVKNSHGVSVSWTDSFDGTFTVHYPQAWDGDTVPILLVTPHPPISDPKG